MGTYCTAQQVVNQLQMLTKDRDERFTPEEDEFPKLSELEQWIEETEAEIDSYTRRAWRSVTITNEYHNNNGLIQIPRTGYWGGARGIYVKLRNRALLPFQSPDKLEVWQSNAWVDMVVSYTKGEAINDKDYWVNEESGEVWITTNIPLLGRSRIRVSYRYGNASAVPFDIRRACILLTATVLMESDTYVRRFLNAQNEYSLPSKVESFRKRAYKILNRHRRYTSSTR